MLNLSTLEPTTRQALYSYSLDVLNRQIQAKFAPSVRTVETIMSGLQKLSLTDLDALFVELVKLENLQQLKMWLDAKRNETSITMQLNEIYEAEESIVERDLFALQIASIGIDSW
jgi:hypothetical protein